MDETPEQRAKPAVGRLEWAVGALGGLIVAGVLGVLTHQAMTQGDGPPVLTPRVISVTPSAAGFVVRFRTENTGASTAAEVVVRARLRRGDAVVEEAEATLDYVARKSDREAGVVFREDPASGALDLAAVSYRKP